VTALLKLLLGLPWIWSYALIGVLARVPTPLAERVPAGRGREKERDEGSMIRSVKADLTSPGALALVSEGVDVVFHLAAIGPDAAEKDFDLGMKVNFDATRSLLARCRRLEVRVL